jgi:nicotinamidase-related amidase
MNIHHIDNKKTALLFFDMLNVYFHGIRKKSKSLKTVVDNAVRLMNGARQAGILIYYAMANHRPMAIAAIWRLPTPTCVCALA